MMTPPEIDPYHPAKLVRAGGRRVEPVRAHGHGLHDHARHAAGRGDVAFAFGGPSRPGPRSAQNNYYHHTPQGEKLSLTYLAGKLIQQPLATVLDEDVLDGTLEAEHKAVVLTGSSTSILR